MKSETERERAVLFVEKLVVLIFLTLFLHYIALGELPFHSYLNFVPKLPVALLNVSTIVPSSAKPYDSFSEFYPEYLKQHQDVTCVRLHYIGTSIIILLAVFDSKIPVSITLGGVIGHILFHAARGTDNGAIEGLGMIGTYLLGMCILGTKGVTRSLSKALLILIIAYGFAWVGHFFYEHNKPATFIYPLYSLLGDFKLWLCASFMSSFLSNHMVWASIRAQIVGGLNCAGPRC